MDIKPSYLNCLYTLESNPEKISIYDDDILMGLIFEQRFSIASFSYS